MITKTKFTEFFCIIDEFDKNFDFKLKKIFSQAIMERNIVTRKLHCWIVK